jgi:hypothetical protein
MPLLLDDTTIGICMHNKKYLGCWDEDNYTKGLFIHLCSPQDGLSDSELLRAASLHYFTKSRGRWRSYIKDTWNFMETHIDYSLRVAKFWINFLQACRKPGRFWIYQGAVG